MLPKEDIAKLLNEMDEYLKKSSEYASGFFISNKIEFEFFQGTKMEMTPDVCESVYRNIIEELIKSQGMFLSKYGLSCAVIPINQNDNVYLTLHLGISFPMSFKGDPNS